MSFRINTNISALTAHTIGVQNNRSLHNSLEKLSSGLRLNKAADDASGMAIADSLRSQSEGLGQAVRNANDAIGIIQVADKAMDEQLKILDTIKTKAIQAAQDGQSNETRKALQSDIIMGNKCFLVHFLIKNFKSEHIQTLPLKPLLVLQVQTKLDMFVWKVVHLVV